MKRKEKCDNRDADNGFAKWGGYMAAKKAKLQDQFLIDAKELPDCSQIFRGVAIFVNGYSVPSADELKLLMMNHGGVYHHYYRNNKTTHIIATNLPDTKIKHLKTLNVVKADWVVDSIASGRLLDYRNYLLYSRQSKAQSQLAFRPILEADHEPSSNTSSVDGISQESALVPKNTTDSENEVSNAIEEEKKIEISSFAVCNKTATVMASTMLNKNISSTSKGSDHSIKTASETGFLSEFYSNSRLHHISTMGATFKQYVNDLRGKNQDTFPGVELLQHWKQNQTSPNIPNKYNSVIMHIDMDCFFVSVGLRDKPDLKGFPVAVTHAKTGNENSINHRAGVDRKAEFELYKLRKEEKHQKINVKVSNLNNDIKPWSDWVDSIEESNSMSEIASCNYEARKYGLKNGMFLGQALKLCPNLKTIPYDFEGYKDVSYCLYNTIASYTLHIEAISCDEMFVDCTDLLNSIGTTPVELASFLRAEIKEKTGCSCSAGFGSNRLQARLATKQAKPDGQFYLQPEAVQAFMADIRVSDLPGVGGSTNYKLSSMGVKTCLDLQQFPLAKLQTDFGLKSGEALYKHCRGEDNKKLTFGQVRKSVSAEVNYGIRFQSQKEAETFFEQLSKEVHTRLKEINMKTKHITLKLMVKAKDAPSESAKFLGHGVCDSISRSTSLQTSVSDIDSITREVLSMSRQLNVDAKELRGIGIQLSRLESVNANKTTTNGIEKFLRPVSEITNDIQKDKVINAVSTLVIQKNESCKTSSSVIDNFFVVKKHLPDQSKSSNTKTIKAAEIDEQVLEALPEDIRLEVIKEYGLEKDYPKEQSTNKRPKELVLNSCDLNYSQIDPKVLDELPVEIKKEIESSVKNRREISIQNNPMTESEINKLKDGNLSPVAIEAEPKLERSLPLTEIRSLIRAWTSSEDSPQSCDITMLANYLGGLVISRQLVSLEICINCLHRCVEKRQSEDWQEAYHAIVSSVQREMMAVYRLRLHVPKTFKSYHLST